MSTEGPVTNSFCAHLARTASHTATLMAWLLATQSTAVGIELFNVDVNEFGSSTPNDVAAVGGLAVMGASFGIEREFHIVDPLDPEAHSTVVQVNPGPAPSFPTGVTGVAGRALFGATVGGDTELYVVDPTNPGAGATPVNINAAGSSHPMNIAQVGTLAVLRATNGDTELHVFDPLNPGAGTTEIDINGAGNSNPGLAIDVGGLAVVTAADNGVDFEVFVADPTNPGAGATEVEVNAGGSAAPLELTSVANLAVFSAFDGTDRELHIVDPTNPGAGSTKIDIVAGPASSNPQHLASVAGRAVFAAGSTRGVELHVVDPTNPGAGSTVIDVADDFNQSSFPTGVASVAARAVFAADAKKGAGNELFIVDPLNPTEDPITLDLNPLGDSNPELITPVAGRAVFRATVDGDEELYVVDPQFPEFGFTRVNINPAGSSAIDQILDVGGRAVFVANNGSETELFVLSFDTTWESNTSGDWDTATNWQGGLVPAAVDNVVIAPTNGLTVTGPAADTFVSNVSIGATTGTATLALSTGALRAHRVTINQGGRLAGSGLANARLDIAPGGELRAFADQHLEIGGAGSTNLGEVNLFGGTVEFTGDLTNQVMGGDNGLIAGQGTLIVSGGLANDANVAFSGGSSQIVGDVDNRAGALIVNTGNGTLTFFDDVVNNGEIRTSGASTTVFLGAFSGGGTTTGTGSVFFEGDLSPGNSAAVLTLQNNVELRASSTLIVELGGTQRGTEYDALEIVGTATLGGTLDVSLADFGSGTYQPVAGDKFEILSATGNIDGEFFDIDLPTVGPGLQWQLLQVGGELSLLAVVAGDFNADGTVSAADYTIWRDSLGTSGLVLAADADADGLVTQADYDQWRANFGQGVAAATLAFEGTVPEPSTLILPLLAAACRALNCRRKREPSVDRL